AARTAGCGGAATGRGDRHAGRLRRRRRSEGRARGGWPRSIPHRAWPQGRQRHGGGCRERIGERGGVMRERLGTLFIVGMGPGDPELLTLKAARIIGAAPVVAYFAKRGCIGHARTIAEGRLGPAPQELRFEYPF